MEIVERGRTFKTSLLKTIAIIVTPDITAAVTFTLSMWLKMSMYVCGQDRKLLVNRRYCKIVVVAAETIKTKRRAIGDVDLVRHRAIGHSRKEVNR